MELIKDKYDIDCFAIMVNEVGDIGKQYGVKTIDYLASEYGNDHYLLRNKGVFGCIVLKKDCTIL